MGVEQFVDQARCFDFVQVTHAFAEAFDGDGLDLVFVELVLFDQLEDELALFFGATPGHVAGQGVEALDGLGGGLCGGLCGVAVRGGGFEAVVGGWDETSLLHLRIHV